MIKVLVKTNAIRSEAIAEVTQTPKAIFDEKGVDISGSVANLNGVSLSVADLNTPFERLGVQDGATVNLSSIVKADAA